MKIITSKLLQSFIHHFDFVEKLSQLNQSKLELLSKKYNMTPDEINTFSNCDPTPNKQYLDWLIKQIQSNTLRLPEDCDKCINTLSLFTVKKQVLKNTNKPIDINQYKSLGDIQRNLDEVMNVNTKRQQVKLDTEQGQRVLLNKPPYKIIEITTKEASAKLCRDTEWCIKDPKFFDMYEISISNPLYLILNNDEPGALFNAQSKQFKDVYDEELDLREEHNTKLLLLLKSIGVDVNTYVMDYVLTNTAVREEQKYIISKFMTQKDILKSPELSFLYSSEVLNKRWKQAEPTIMKDPAWAFRYCSAVLRGRWPEAEPYIMQSPQYSFMYAKYVIGKRWANAEPTIMQSPRYSYQYATDILHSRWPEAEPTIMKDPENATNYASHILNTRWTEAEPYIMKEPQWAYIYAKHVIHSRWLEAEEVILNSNYRDNYYNCFYQEFNKSNKEFNERYRT